MGLSCALTFNIIFGEFNCQCNFFAELAGFANIDRVVTKEKTSCFYGVLQVCYSVGLSLIKPLQGNLCGSSKCRFQGSGAC